MKPSDLPPPPVPQGDYLPAVVAGGIAVSAGMTPRVNGRLTVQGRVGDSLTMDETRAAAAVAAANAVRAIAEAVGGIEAITQCLRMSVFIACGPDFDEQSKVADAASAVLVALLGTRGRAARSAIGVAALPSGAPVEVELTAAVSDRR